MTIFLFARSEQSKNFLRGGAVLARERRLGYGGGMLSVVIETRNHEDALARTLASLVGGAVEGVVREVIVCDAGSGDHTHIVAEHAGCRYLADAKARAGIALARGEWLLLLEPGARLMDGWMDAVLAHAGDAEGPARFSRASRPLIERVFAARRPLAEGLVITKRQALSLAEKDGSADSIARSVSPRRLAARIVVAPKG